MNAVRGRVVAVQRVKRAVSVQQLLEWAFRVERVTLELPQHEEALIGAGYGQGSSLRLIRRAELGCRVDGGGTSPCHEDAEVVAAVVSNLPDALGGRSMAARVAEVARRGDTPDWMPGAVPKVVPALVAANAAGGRPTRSVVIGQDVIEHRGRQVTYDIRMCPITWSPSVPQIMAARREYLRWCLALVDIRASLTGCRMLRAHEVTGALPPRQPWLKKCVD